MAIRVTCPGCMTRFQVSDQYGGRKGPCPKCKKEITIPKADADVKIHEREFGPKDSAGKAVLKPIFREEVRISVPAIVGIALTIVVSLVAALSIRFQYPQGEGLEIFPWWPLIAGAVILAVPLVLGGYAMLRDAEIKPHVGKELWMRVAICAALYALLWLVFPVAAYAFNNDYNVVCLIVASVIILGIGGFVGLATFDFEYIIGLVHFGFYFAACIMLRWIATGSALPFEG